MLTQRVPLVLHLCSAMCSAWCCTRAVPCTLPLSSSHLTGFLVRISAHCRAWQSGFAVRVAPPLCPVGRGPWVLSGHHQAAFHRGWPPVPFRWCGGAVLSLGLWAPRWGHQPLPAGLKMISPVLPLPVSTLCLFLHYFFSGAVSCSFLCAIIIMLISG